MNHAQAVKRFRAQAAALCASRRPFTGVADELERTLRGIHTLRGVRTPGRLEVIDHGARPPSEARPFLLLVAECPCGRLKLHAAPRGRFCSAVCRSKASKAAARARRKAAGQASAPCVAPHAVTPTHERTGGGPAGGAHLPIVQPGLFGPEPAPTRECWWASEPHRYPKVEAKRRERAYRAGAPLRWGDFRGHPEELRTAEILGGPYELLPEPKPPGDTRKCFEPTVLEGAVGVPIDLIGPEGPVVTVQLPHHCAEMLERAGRGARVHLVFCGVQLAEAPPADAAASLSRPAAKPAAAAADEPRETAA